MDFIRVELEEKYFADVEPWEEYIAFSVYIKSGDFSGWGTFVYTVNEFRELISQLKLIYITLDGDKSRSSIRRQWRDNWVKLLLNTDQTVLNKVIQQCNSILKN